MGDADGPPINTKGEPRVAHEIDQLTMPSPQRNASAAELRQALELEEEIKLDTVASGGAISARAGNIVVGDRVYRPNAVADEGIAAKLNIPLPYLRRMRAEAPDLYDLNVGGWLEREPERKFLLRAFRGTPGTLRAFLSDSYRVIDHLDVLAAALEGVKEARHPIKILGADLTDRRMVVRVESEAVKVMARELLKGYRSPFTGQSGEDLPVVSAGFVLANSEVGSGRYTITPQIVVQVCSNGLTITKDALGRTHLGAKLDEGVIRYSEETQRRNLSLITSQTRDAVAMFMDHAYVEQKLTEIEREAGRKVEKPAETIEYVSKRLRFSDSVRESIFDHFIAGGQVTAGGVMQAVTATAQTLSDGDAAYELQGQALTAMSLAAAA
ncbi:DUF932 domain-containing protein [Streptomyces sp. SRF1]|uniref:DUF932 domain-containing protein n=1 Tax=Streptomyces sp. SRF1 TaxID=1549642 RepID=UPI0025B1BE2E|nr:DUF932 domain-containing protein [Streptomyces sp. SRF1]MDN3059365.1 DUF932 domain-containing protein [Streptomyces sp. SRF1]